MKLSQYPKKLIEYRARKLNLTEQRKRFNNDLKIGKKEDEFYALPDDKDLTPEQIKEIDAFWGKWSFMVKIDHRAFKTFYNRSGIFDPKYIPHYFNRFFIKPNTAPAQYATSFQNKAYLPKLMPNAKQPETIVRRVEGIYYNEKFQKISSEEAIRICLDVLKSGREIVVKPSGQAGGAGVEFLSKATEKQLARIFRSKGTLFIVQKAIRQHPEMAALNESTVNTVRLTTFMYKGQFIPMAALIKVGAPSVRVDNYKHGGCLIGVNLDGTVLPWALDINRQHITELPSGIKLGTGEDCFTKVPCFDSVLEMAEKAHYDIPKIKLISWDIAIDDENEAEIIEANFGGDLRMHQVLTGPVFGEWTEKIIDYYVYRKFCKPGITKEFDYNEYPDHIEITKCVDDNSQITIPAMINEKPVTVIGPYAFAFKNTLQSVTLPDTVQILRSHAFFACTKMKAMHVTIDNLKTVEKGVVNRCPKLKNEFKTELRNCMKYSG